MRITVTVVVIMFELTGALTYILPTMVSHRLHSVMIDHRLTSFFSFSFPPLDRSFGHQSRWRFLGNQWHRRRDDQVQWLSVLGKGRSRI